MGGAFWGQSRRRAVLGVAKERRFPQDRKVWRSEGEGVSGTSEEMVGGGLRSPDSRTQQRFGASPVGWKARASRDHMSLDLRIPQ